LSETARPCPLNRSSSSAHLIDRIVRAARDWVSSCS
jgi:hypothetical protein